MATRTAGAAAREAPPPFASRPTRIWLLALILLGAAGLRVAPLTDFRFHPDEALFATLGRLIITGDDPLLAQTTLLVDKPPLFYYTLAGGISVSWGSELSARLPGLFASLLTVALAARLAGRLWGPAAAVVAAGLVALSPFAILFAPTAFSDPLLVLWVLGALVAAAEGRALLAGVLAGLALATKQSAVLFVPLVLAVGLACTGSARRWWRFMPGLGTVLVLVALWEWQRLAAGAASSAWLAGLAINDPHGLAAVPELWPRVREWLDLLRYFAGSAVLSAALCALAAAAPLLDGPPRREGLATLALALFTPGYLALHWLLAVPVFDRYLLPLVPLVALLAARTVSLLAVRYGEKQVLRAALPALVVLLLPGALRAARGGYPIGGDHGAYDGIDEVAAALRVLPEGGVVYDEALGWSLAYYLYDAEVYRAHVGGPEALAADLRAFGSGEEVRVLVLPGWQSHAPELIAVEVAGFEADVMLETRNRYGERSFVVYRLRPAADP